jgi:hypothetical protein
LPILFTKKKYNYPAYKTLWEESITKLDVSYEWKFQKEWSRIAVAAEVTPHPILQESEEELSQSIIGVIHR